MAVEVMACLSLSCDDSDSEFEIVMLGDWSVAGSAELASVVDALRFGVASIRC